MPLNKRHSINCIFRTCFYSSVSHSLIFLPPPFKLSTSTGHLFLSFWFWNIYRILKRTCNFFYCNGGNDTYRNICDDLKHA
jgi:hypothetical protein